MLIEAPEVALPTPRFLGSLDSDLSLITTTFRSGDIVVDGGILHGGSGNGYLTIDVSDPTKPKMLGTSALASPAIIHSLALNGSGRMISLISFSASNRDVAIYDASNPTNVDNFLGSFDTRGVSRDHDLASGVAIVADFTAGLTFVNTSTLDGNLKPPQVLLDLAYLDEDATRAGIQVRAGRSVPVHATVSDDVQLRDARLLLNGQEVEALKSGPILFTLELPGSTETNRTVTVQVEASDTGGNVGASAAVAIELIRDAEPPVLVASVPHDGGGAFTSVGFAFRFNEPVSVGTGAAVLHYMGADGISGNADDIDVPVGSVQTLGATLRITQANALAPGNYRLTVPASLVSDRSGIRLSQELVIGFTAFPASLDTAVWISRSDGRYDDPANWLYNRVPGHENVLLPEGIGQPVVSVTTEDNILLRLESHLPMHIENGAELSVEKEWISTAPLVISNASAFVNLSATFNSPVHVTRGELQLYAPATFNGLLTIDRGGVLSLKVPTAKADIKAGLAAVNFSVIVENGAAIELPQFVNYDGPGDFTLFLAAGTRFQARGAGSKITLPELVTANGPTNWNVRSVATLRFQANDGGVIEAPKLETLTGRVSLNASGDGGKISAPKLATVTGPVSDFISAIDLGSLGEITLAQTATITRCNVTLDAPSVLRGGIIELATDSTLKGSGTISASLLNRGLVTLDRTPDALIVEGNLELSTASVINSTLGLGTAKTDAGHLDVRGTASLAGMLRLTLPRNFTPTAGQEFILALLANGSAGSFAQIDDAALGTLKAEILATAQNLMIHLATRP
jgi:hypothetical protein